LAAALSSAPSRLSAESRALQAGALVKEARAARLPVLRFATDLTALAREESLTLEAGSFGSFTLPIPPYPTITLPQEDYKVTLMDTFRLDFKLTLEQPLWTWGRISESIRAAETGALAAELEVLKEESRIAARLDISLESLAFFEKMQEILNAQGEAAERLSVLSQESYESGFLLRSELYASRVAAAEVRLGLQSLEENRSRALLSLRTLTGLANLEAGDLILPSPSPEAPDGDPEALINQAALGNFDLRLLGLNREAARYQLGAERSRSYFKPDLGLYLQLNYRNPDLRFLSESLPHDNFLNLSATLGIRSLLFDGGAQSARIKREEENLAQASLSLEAALADLGEYIRGTLLELELSELRQDYIRLQIEEAKSRHEQAQNEAAAGYGEERESLIQELTWHLRRLSLLQEQLTARIRRIELAAIVNP
jgi:outer membrane protein TolC